MLYNTLVESYLNEYYGSYYRRRRNKDLGIQAAKGAGIGALAGLAAKGVGVDNAVAPAAIAGAGLMTSKELLDRFKRKHPNWHKLLTTGALLATGAAAGALGHAALTDNE